jgi:hypothetical protein
MDINTERAMRGEMKMCYFIHLPFSETDRKTHAGDQETQTFNTERLLHSVMNNIITGFLGNGVIFIEICKSAY